MSQIDTRKWILVLSVGLLLSSSAFAQTTPLRACVDSQLIQMGVDPAMQNRWNPNLIAGKLQIRALQLCLGQLKMGKAEELTPTVIQTNTTIDLDAGDGGSMGAI